MRASAARKDWSLRLRGLKLAPIPDPHMPADYFKPAFVVGVTGHMDLDPGHRDRVKVEVKRIFTWLRGSPGKQNKNESNTALGPGLDLKNTPIILLSSLAPGADQWVVEAAREMDPPLRALAPLPFLKDQYLEASTFKRDGVTKDEAASKFLAEFPDEDAFVVRLRDELDLDDDALRAKHNFIVTGPDGKQERDRRYAAAGEYVAAYSDILIALTDKPIGQAETAMLDPNENQGARAIAELKRRGITPGLLPILPTLSWADNGPVIHVYAPRKPKEASGIAENWSCAEAKSLEVLYPYDCRPPGISERERATIPTGSKPVTRSSKSSLSIWNGSTQRIFNLTQLEKTGRSPSCSPQLPICRQEHRGLTHSQTQTSI